MADKIPEHRTATEPRSGDTHEIGKDGKLRNLDEAEREAAKPKRPPEPAAKPAE